MFHFLKCNFYNFDLFYVLYFNRHENLELIPNRYSTILYLSKEFYDAEHFDSIEYVFLDQEKKITHNTSSPLKTSIKLKYLNETMKTITLKDLINGSIF